MEEIKEEKIVATKYLKQQTRNVRCIVSYPFTAKLDDVCDRFQKDGYTYAMIVHDKDFKGNGELKKKHVHIVLYALKRHELAFYIRYLAHVFNKGTTDAIEVLPSMSQELDIQYLIHKNDVDKFQYDEKNIRTNIDSVNLRRILDAEVDSTTTVYDVLHIVQTSANRTEVILRLGNHYLPFSRVVDAFINDKHLGEMLNLETAHL